MLAKPADACGAFCAGFNIFGELKGQPSRLSPTSAVDTVVSEKAAAGLGVASTMLLAEVLSSANRRVPPSLTPSH